MPELCDLDAVALRQLIGRREVSPVALLESCIARIEAVDPAVNAVPARCFARARQEAAAAERQVREGRPLGPLHGLPVGIKDVQQTGGLVTTYGSPLYRDNVPARDEALVAAIRQAGGIVIGKTNTPEFAAGANTVNPVYGATRNPFDPPRTCGGSSGGSAVALACGMLPLATGSDLGGSLRTPAAFCGVVGFRPSPGLVPAEHRFRGWSPLHVPGPMARTVADIALLLSVIARPVVADPLTRPDTTAIGALTAPADLAGLRLAVSEDLGFAPVSRSIRQTFRTVMERIDRLFAAAERRDPPLEDADAVFGVLRALDFLAALYEPYTTARDRLGPNIVANIEQGLGFSALDVARAEAAQTALYRRFVGFMADFDALICPAVAVPPFPIEQLYVERIDGRALETYYHWFAVAYGLTLTAHPVAVIPCGRDETGTPFGLQICGRRGDDRSVLAIAAALEGALQTMPDLARPRPDVAALAASGPAV